MNPWKGGGGVRPAFCFLRKDGFGNLWWKGCGICISVYCRSGSGDANTPGDSK